MYTSSFVERVRWLSVSSPKQALGKSGSWLQQLLQSGTGSVLRFKRRGGFFSFCTSVAAVRVIHGVSKFLATDAGGSTASLIADQAWLSSRRGDVADSPADQNANGQPAPRATAHARRPRHVAQSLTARRVSAPQQGRHARRRRARVRVPVRPAGTSVGPLRSCRAASLTHPRVARRGVPRLRRTWRCVCAAGGVVLRRTVHARRLCAACEGQLPKVFWAEVRIGRRLHALVHAHELISVPSLRWASRVTSTTTSGASTQTARSRSRSARRRTRSSGSWGKRCRGKNRRIPSVRARHASSQLSCSQSLQSSGYLCKCRHPC